MDATPTSQGFGGFVLSESGDGAANITRGGKTVRELAKGVLESNG